MVSTLLLPHCARAEHPPPPSIQAQSTQSRSQEHSLQSLKADFPEAQVFFDEDTKHPSRITGLTPSARITADSIEEFTRAVLKTPSIANLLGLSADLRELCHSVTQGDPQRPDYAVVRMEQCLGPAKVLGGGLVMSVRLKPSPSIEHLTSSLADIDVKALAITPKIPPVTAEKLGAEAVAKLAESPAMKGRVRPSDERFEPELVIFDPRRFRLDGPPRLCWFVRRHGIVVLIDALDGSVVHQFEQSPR